MQPITHLAWPWGITAWKAVWVESGMLSLSTVLTGNNNGQVTDPHSCDGIELLWMKRYVPCLCLCYFITLSVWTALSGTDRRHDPAAAIAKQIHCHIDCLTRILTKCLCWWTLALFCFLGSNMAVGWKQYTPFSLRQQRACHNKSLHTDIWEPTNCLIQTFYYFSGCWIMCQS